MKRIALSIRKRIARLFWPNGRGIMRRDGVLYLINVNSRDYYDKQILRGDIDEKEHRHFMLQNIMQRKCDIFVDIGANYGLYALSVAKHTQCSTIFAYEPSPRSYGRLRANLLVNDLTGRVQTRMVAVSNSNGSVPFILAPDGNDFLSKVGESAQNYNVPSVRLDDELPIAGQRIALKIDVEGHELHALEGMKVLLRSNDCFLQIECWNVDAIVAAMETQGYNVLHRIGAEHYFAKASAH